MLGYRASGRCVERGGGIRLLSFRESGMRGKCIYIRGERERMGISFVREGNGVLGMWELVDVVM
jgi:hypothetical protein